MLGEDPLFEALESKPKWGKEGVLSEVSEHSLLFLEVPFKGKRLDSSSMRRQDQGRDSL